MGKQAMEGSRFNGFFVDPTKMVIVGLDTEDGPEHPLYDERVKKAIDPSMVANVKTFGVETPIMVTKKGDQILVVAGRQRVRWARAANEELVKEGVTDLIEVPAVLHKGDDVSLFGKMVTENEAREDDDILTKAEKAKRMLAMKKVAGGDVTIEEVANRFGVTDRAIRQWLAILELSPKVKKAVKDGRLTATAASKLQGKSVEEQEADLDELIAEADATGKKKVSTSKVNKKAKGTGNGPSRKLLIAMSEVAPHPYCTLLGWILGEMDDSTFLSECPDLAKWIDKALKKTEPDPKEPKKAKEPKAAKAKK
jgi:hypothetical protein